MMPMVLQNIIHFWFQSNYQYSVNAQCFQGHRLKASIYNENIAILSSAVLVTKHFGPEVCYV